MPARGLGPFLKSWVAGVNKGPTRTVMQSMQSMQQLSIMYRLGAQIIYLLNGRFRGVAKKIFDRLCTLAQSLAASTAKLHVVPDPHLLPACPLLNKSHDAELQRLPRGRSAWVSTMAGFAAQRCPGTCKFCCPLQGL
jgi:hypothetical protein